MTSPSPPTSRTSSSVSGSCTAEVEWEGADTQYTAVGRQCAVVCSIRHTPTYVRVLILLPRRTKTRIRLAPVHNPPPPLKRRRCAQLVLFVRQPTRVRPTWELLREVPPGRPKQWSIQRVQAKAVTTTATIDTTSVAQHRVGHWFALLESPVHTRSWVRHTHTPANWITAGQGNGN